MNPTQNETADVTKSADAERVEPDPHTCSLKALERMSPVEN